ncbi:hypothetical protein FRC01_003851 [Tulasnella sp. 417]|nr:hypothetical protein FRC01_003851 [Tulasnella sp. 417]
MLTGLLVCLKLTSGRQRLHGQPITRTPPLATPSAIWTATPTHANEDFAGETGSVPADTHLHHNCLPLASEREEIDTMIYAGGDNQEPASRGRVVLRLPDHLPEGPRAPSRSPSPEIRRPGQRRLVILRKWVTAPNRFGLYREYYRKPSIIPDLGADLANFTSSSLLPRPMALPLLPPPTLKKALGPFPNYSTFIHARWLWTTEGAGNSDAANRALIETVYLDEKFVPLDVKTKSFERLKKAVANYQPDPLYKTDGWKESSVTISVPLGKPRPGSQPDFPPAAEFTVPGLRHRSIVDIVQRVIRTDPNVRDFHLHPFRQYVQGQDGKPPSRVIDDIYSSNAMMDEYEKLQRSPREPGCPFERVIFALQFWSDATLLANFGSAKLWPIYMYFGNQPKWARSRSDKHACHDIAYIPSLPATFQDFVSSQRGFPADSKLETHCRRELFHEVWKLLLDKKFIRAYKHGLLILFPDGMIRRVYLRIITYSADYPEKVIIATIRNLGICLCPRCLIVRHQIRKLGTKADTKLRSQRRRVDNDSRRALVAKSRIFVYERRQNVVSAWVEANLRQESLVPTTNAFSLRLGRFGFDFFLMLCVDILHEFELGVWKAILQHLIRMLHAVGESAVVEMDRRFRQVPSFGRDTIRRISHNVSELKQLAARDFEDILQCALPVFEGLFPEEFDTSIQRLLFVLSDWHSFAKLRMHTDGTLEILSLLTKTLGQELRYFEKHVANKVETFETPREARSRARRNLRGNANTTRGKGGQGSNLPEIAARSRKAKLYTLDTYKVHALGDYVSQIRQFGTLDVTSTQLGEARHRQKKRQYERTNKRNFESQIATQTGIVENMRRIDQQVALANGLPSTPSSMTQPQPAEDTVVGQVNTRYHIASNGEWVSLSTLLHQTKDDCAFQHFRVQLLDHITARLRGRPYSWDELLFQTSDYTDVDLHKDRLYSHGASHFNYTTYDIRRCQDTIKPALRISPIGVVKSGYTGRCTVMLASDEDDGRSQHQFWYARVLGIFHCEVRRRSSPEANYERMDIMWIRWLGVDPDRKGGTNLRRLDRVGYVPDSDKPGAFGFINPADVIRGCHLIPTFHEGTRDDLLSGSSVAFDLGDEDYQYYSVMRFVDRDMAMRYRGGGVGHVNRYGQPEDMDCTHDDPDPATGQSLDVDEPLDSDQDLSDSEREMDSDMEEDEVSSDDGYDDSESELSESEDNELELDVD